MGIKKIIASALTSVMMISMAPVTVMAADSVGWNGNDTDGWRYYCYEYGYIFEDWKKNRR